MEESEKSGVVNELVGFSISGKWAIRLILIGLNEKTRLNCALIWIVEDVKMTCTPRQLALD